MRTISILGATAAALHAFLFTTTGSKATPTLTLEPQHQISDRLEHPATSQARYRVVDNVYLNVRDGASPDYDIIGVIPAGATGVRIDDCVGGSHQRLEFHPKPPV
jgi:hypothetical protein